MEGGEGAPISYLVTYDELFQTPSPQPHGYVRYVFRSCWYLDSLKHPLTTPLPPATKKTHKNKKTRRLWTWPPIIAKKILSLAPPDIPNFYQCSDFWKRKCGVVTKKDFRHFFSSIQIYWLCLLSRGCDKCGNVEEIHFALKLKLHITFFPEFDDILI